MRLLVVIGGGDIIGEEGDCNGSGWFDEMRDEEGVERLEVKEGGSLDLEEFRVVDVAVDVSEPGGGGKGPTHSASLRSR